MHGSAHINWRYKDLQHPLLFAENFKISGLTDGKSFQQDPKWCPFHMKEGCQALHL
jgi:hypothetical protein